MPFQPAVTQDESSIQPPTSEVLRHRSYPGERPPRQGVPGWLSQSYDPMGTAWNTRSYEQKSRKSMVVLMIMKNWVVGLRCAALKETSGQIILFHQPRFPWNKRNSLSYLPFGARSCEVAIIWPETWSVITPCLARCPFALKIEGNKTYCTIFPRWSCVLANW